MRCWSPGQPDRGVAHPHRLARVVEAARFAAGRGEQVALGIEHREAVGRVVGDDDAAAVGVCAQPDGVPEGLEAGDVAGVGRVTLALRRGAAEHPRGLSGRDEQVVCAHRVQVQQRIWQAQGGGDQPLFALTVGAQFVKDPLARDPEGVVDRQ